MLYAVTRHTARIRDCSRSAEDGTNEAEKDDDDEERAAAIMDVNVCCGIHPISKRSVI
jgi:hypothetical protein